MPREFENLEPRQIGFVNELANALRTCRWTTDEIRRAIESTCPVTPIDVESALAALKLVLCIDDVSLEVFLEQQDRDEVIATLTSYPVPLVDFWQQTSISVEDFETWLGENVSEISAISVFPKLQLLSQDLQNAEFSTAWWGMGVLEFRVTMTTGAALMKRVKYSSVKGFDTSSARELEYFDVYGRDYIDELVSNFGLPIKRQGLFAS